MRAAAGEWAVVTVVGLTFFGLLAATTAMAGWRVKLPEPATRRPRPARPRLRGNISRHDGSHAQASDHRHSGPRGDSGTGARTVWPLFDVAANDPRIKYPMQNGMPTLPPERARVAYLLPFEIVSIHLTVVLIGAAYLARAKRRREVSA